MGRILFISSCSGGKRTKVPIPLKRDVRSISNEKYRYFSKLAIFSIKLFFSNFFCNHQFRSLNSHFYTENCILANFYRRKWWFFYWKWRSNRNLSKFSSPKWNLISNSSFSSWNDIFQHFFSKIGLFSPKIIIFYHVQGRRLSQTVSPGQYVP